MPKRNFCRRRAAFTLVELAIVLVIIGLITGGIIVGQALIETAKYRQQARQIETINAAVNTFKLKYGCLPGDCAFATRYFSATTQPEKITNGNGNEMINSYTLYGRDQDQTYSNSGWAPTYSDEWASVFDHLAAAGLFDLGMYDETSTSSDKPGIGYPRAHVTASTQYSTYTNSISGVVVGWEPKVAYKKGGHVISLSRCSQVLFGANVPNMQRCGVSAEQARLLDEKLDDGFPYTGKMVPASSTDYLYDIPAGTSGCADYATNTYKVKTSSSVCPIRISASF